MGCTDCGKTMQSQEEFAIVYREAKELAVKSGCNVFIYQTPEGWKYMAEAPARSIGIIPNGGIVSRFVHTT